MESNLGLLGEVKFFDHRLAFGEFAGVVVDAPAAAEREGGAFLVQVVALTCARLRAVELALALKTDLKIN